MTKIVKLMALLLAALVGLSACQSSAPEQESIEYADIAGVVTEIADGYILIHNADQGEVQVNVSDDTIYEGTAIAVGDYIHVTYSGAMTRSLPPQISALRVGCYVRTGTVSAVEEGGFMLAAEGEEIRVNAEKALMEGVTEGATVTVYFNGAMTMSLPAQIGAEMIEIRNYE